ncbi:MAG TPA: radical SAM/SPASM domain-containing protein [Chitinispirillaceae bacterium]|nr:radical SAM/SPASM domain-containing protein [Chitinispirillaceae bacterium]
MKKFRKTYIEITNVCNLKCPFCPQNTREPRVMNAQEFQLVLEQLAPHTSLLHFHVLGEPLLHPQTGMFLDMCEQSKTPVHLVTNGTLFHARIDDLLEKKALRSVSFSLQSICACSTINEFRHYLDLLLNSIGIFKGKKKPLFNLRLWNNGSVSETISFTDAVIEIGKRFKCDNLIETLHSQRALMLNENISINTAERFEWPHNDAPLVGDTGSCLGLREQIAVLVDGTVVPCCLDSDGSIELGNLFTTPIDTILSSGKVRNIRSAFQKKRITENICKRCSYRTRFSLIKEQPSPPAPLAGSGLKADI